jgi:hypothetical protein
MQAYKIYALSLLAGLFAVVQSLSTLGWGIWVSTTLMWLAGGIVAGGLFFCLGRFMWYGAMVSATISTPFEMDQSSRSPPMGQLEYQIGRTTLADAQRLSGVVGWMIRLGYNRRVLLCFSLGILAAMMAIRVIMILIS